MEYKKELVDTGCKNKHQTCKDCLDKIQKNKRRRGLDHNIRNGYHRDSEPYYFKYKCPFCRGAVNIECGRDEYYNNYNDNDYGYADYESDEEFWRRDEDRLEDVASPNDILVGRLAERLIENESEVRSIFVLDIPDGVYNDEDEIIYSHPLSTMHMENLRETYPSRRYANREEEEEDRRDHMEDRRESMRERARENRARENRAR
jgi:hypothetical protein